MPIDRFFYEGELQKEALISLEEAEHHHLAHVTKNSVGQHITLVNGKGFLAQAEIKQIQRRSSLLQIQQVEHHPQKTTTITLAQAIVRMNRLDTIIEKTTELGVDSIYLFPGELSEKETLYDNQLQRLRSVAISALKQCGRLYLPEIIFYPPISQWKKEDSLLFFGDIDPNAPPLWKEAGARHMLFVTGPESGLSSKEIEQLKKLNGHGVSLHHNILRTDTASIAALALLQALAT